MMSVKERVSSSGQMDPSSREPSKMESRKAKVLSLGQMATHMKATLRVIRLMVKGSIDGPMDEFTKVNGRRAKYVAMVRSHGQMDAST